MWDGVTAHTRFQKSDVVWCRWRTVSVAPAVGELGTAHPATCLQRLPDLSRRQLARTHSASLSRGLAWPRANSHGLSSAPQPGGNITHSSHHGARAYVLRPSGHAHLRPDGACACVHQATCGVHGACSASCTLHQHTPHCVVPLHTRAHTQVNELQGSAKRLKERCTGARVSLRGSVRRTPTPCDLGLQPARTTCLAHLFRA